MQQYVVLKDCRLMIQGSEYRRIKALVSESNALFPCIKQIYCGNVFWETRLIREHLGSDLLEFVPTESISHLLPLMIKPSHQGLELEEQLERAWGVRFDKPYRIVLMNGTGTMLGDSLFGASVARALIDHLKAKGVHLEFDVALAVNAARGSELIWQRLAPPGQLRRGAQTLEQLCQYDAMIDFCQLLKLKGYATEQRFDFYLDHFGVSPARLASHLKKPRLAVRNAALVEVGERLEMLRHQGTKRLTFLQPDASTPVRSMPPGFLSALVERLLKDPSRRIVATSAMLRALNSDTSIIDFHELTKDSIDHYVALLAHMTELISVDTLALNIACGLKKPTLGFFSQSEPDILSKYWPELFPVVLPGAETLPFWHRHKADDSWPQAEPLYRSAWLELDIDQIVSQWEHRGGP